MSADEGLLTEELLLNVFGYLSSKDLSTTALVCKQWQRLSSDNYLWLPLIQDIVGDYQKSKDDSRSFKQIYLQDIRHVPAAAQKLINILETQGNFLPATIALQSFHDIVHHDIRCLINRIEKINNFRSLNLLIKYLLKQIATNPKIKHVLEKGFNYKRPFYSTPRLHLNFVGEKYNINHILAFLGDAETLRLLHVNKIDINRAALLLHGSAQYNLFPFDLLFIYNIGKSTKELLNIFFIDACGKYSIPGTFFRAIENFAYEIVYALNLLPEDTQKFLGENNWGNNETVILRFLENCHQRLATVNNFQENAQDQNPIVILFKNFADILKETQNSEQAEKKLMEKFSNGVYKIFKTTEYLFQKWPFPTWFHTMINDNGLALTSQGWELNDVSHQLNPP